MSKGITVVDRTTNPPTVRPITEAEVKRIASAQWGTDVNGVCQHTETEKAELNALLDDFDRAPWDGHGTQEAWTRARYRAKPLWQKLRGCLPPYGHGSGDAIFGIMVYGDAPPAWVKTLHRIGRWIDDRIYYPLHYWLARYDVVRTDLGFRYADVDRRMWFACFALLGEFVEGELGRETLDDDHAHCYKGYRLHSAEGTDQQAIDLWIWYLGQKRNGFEWPGQYRPEEYEAIWAWEAEVEQKFDDLMAIRRALWT